MWGQTETGSLSPWRSEPTCHTDVCRNSDMLGLFPSTGSSAFWEVFVLIPRSLSSTRAILVLILCGMAFIYVFIFFLKRFFLVCVLVFCLCVSVRTTSWILWNLESQMVMSHHVGTSCSARAVIALSHWPISLGLVFHSFVYFYIITWIGLSVERDLFSFLTAIELATVTLCRPPPQRYHPIHVRSCPWKLHTASGDEACGGPVEAWCLGSTSYCSCSPFRGRAEATALALGWPCILAICSFCPWLLKHLFCWLLKCLHIVGNLNIA